MGNCRVFRNHFNEWLAQFQAKEKAELPEDIYKDILTELKKNIYFDPRQLKYTDVRQILKKLKYNKYMKNPSKNNYSGK